MRPTVVSLVLALLVSLLAVGRPAEAAPCGTAGTPTTTVYLPNITKTLGGSTGWVTPFIVQNVGSVATTLEVSFYRFSDGGLVVCRSVPGLLPGTSFADIPNSDADLPGNSQFSVVVRSFGADVVAVVNEHQGEAARAESLSYVGLTSGAMKVGLPWVAKLDGGWLTTFIVQNLGAASATVSAALVSEDGTKTASLTRTILPGRSAAVNPANEPGLENGLSYAAVFTSDQPIGVVANAHSDAPTVAQPMAFSYNGVPSATGDVYLPWAGRNVDGGRYSTVVIQNLGTADASPTLTYRRIGGTEQVVVLPGPIGPGRAVEHALPVAGGSCPASGSSTCPREGEHSLVVSGGSFAVLGYAVGAASAMGLAGGGSSPARAYLPNVTRALGGPSGWTTPIVLQSAGATSAILRWYRFADGSLAATQYVGGLTPGASVRIDPRTVTGLADETQYAVVADAGGGSLRSVVLELNSLGGDGAMAYEGFTATGPLTAAPVVSSLVLSPAASTVTLGGTAQLTATGKDQSGNAVVGVPVTWTLSPSSLGTISAGGLFTAASSAGSGTVMAAFGSLSSTATVTVAAATTTIGGFTFNVRTTASADVYTESTITTADAQTIATTVEADMAGVQMTYGRAFTARPPVYVLPTTVSYTTGLQTVLGVTALQAAISGPQTSGLFRWTSGAQGITSQVALNWEKVRTEQPLTTLRHELVHMMIQQVARETSAKPVPAWINEGSAALEQFNISGTQYSRMRYRYTAASMVAVRNYFSVEDLTSQDAWNARTGAPASAQYYQASQIVQLLRDDIGTAGVVRIFDLMGQGQTFEAAFATAAGRPFLTFAADVPSRLQALSQFYPYLATAPDEPGRAPGLSYIAYGFAPGSTIQLDILGQAQGYENTTKSWTVDEYGVRSIYFGPGWPADTYSFTVTGLTPPSSDQPNTSVTIQISAVKAASFEGLSLTW